jgi:hypothetical protein
LVGFVNVAPEDANVYCGKEGEESQVSHVDFRSMIIQGWSSVLWGRSLIIICTAERL